MANDFYGMPAGALDNGLLRVEYLTTAGPRLVRLLLAGVAGNLLAETPRWHWDTPYGRFSTYGGHRLWHAPEAMPRTYVPDSSGLVVEELADGVCLRGPVEEPTGIRKAVEIHLAPGRPALTLRHSLENCGKRPAELAPWAITQLRPGGMVILPQPSSPVDQGGLQPNRHLVLWPYASWSDSRLHLSDAMVTIAARPGPAPLKVGYLNRDGWAAYWREGLLFCKRFAAPEGERYPDLQCNVEVYCCDEFVELETLAPLRVLAPGEAVLHGEEWELWSDPARAPQEVRAVLDGLPALPKAAASV